MFRCSFVCVPMCMSVFVCSILSKRPPPLTLIKSLSSSTDSLLAEVWCQSPDGGWLICPTAPWWFLAADSESIDSFCLWVVLQFSRPFIDLLSNISYTDWSDNEQQTGRRCVWKRVKPSILVLMFSFSQSLLDPNSTLNTKGSQVHINI